MTHAPPPGQPSAGGRRALRAGVMLMALSSLAALADMHEDQARLNIEAMPCGNGTLGARLEEESRTHSRRDLGWRFFPEGDSLTVERAFRISKSMEARYRWQVDHDAHITPISDAAKSLCAP
ncbi:hypothetical protein JCM19379_10720 [Methyloparacoccus murrellii]